MASHIGIIIRKVEVLYIQFCTGLHRLDPEPGPRFEEFPIPSLTDFVEQER